MNAQRHFFAISAFQSDLSPGQMLLMGFDGLFTCFDTEIDHLMSGIVSLDFPDSWAKVDAIREARALQVNIIPIHHWKSYLLF